LLNLRGVSFFKKKFIDLIFKKMAARITGTEREISNLMIESLLVFNDDGGI